MFYSGCCSTSRLANWKVNAIKRSRSAPQYYISVEGWRFVKKIKTAVYMMEIGVRVDDDNVMLFTCEKRYSELRALHKSLEKSNCNIPQFPPKKFFGKNDINFMRKRNRLLHSYFEQLQRIIILERNKSFSDFFSFEKIKMKWTENVQCMSLISSDSSSFSEFLLN